MKKAWRYALIIEIILIFVIFLCSQFLGEIWFYIAMALHFPSSLMAYHLAVFLDYHTPLGDADYLLFIIYAISIIFQVFVLKAFIEGIKKPKDEKNER